MLIASSGATYDIGSGAGVSIVSVSRGVTIKKSSGSSSSSSKSSGGSSTRSSSNNKETVLAITRPNQYGGTTTIGVGGRVTITGPNNVVRQSYIADPDEVSREMDRILKAEKASSSSYNTKLALSAGLVPGSVSAAKYVEATRRGETIDLNKLKQSQPRNPRIEGGFNIDKLPSKKTKSPQLAKPTQIKIDPSYNTRLALNAGLVPGSVAADKYIKNIEKGIASGGTKQALYLRLLDRAEEGEKRFNVAFDKQEAGLPLVGKFIDKARKGDYGYIGGLIYGISGFAIARGLSQAPGRITSAVIIPAAALFSKQGRKDLKDYLDRAYNIPKFKTQSYIVQAYNPKTPGGLINLVIAGTVIYSIASSQFSAAKFQNELSKGSIVKSSNLKPVGGNVYSRYGTMKIGGKNYRFVETIKISKNQYPGFIKKFKNYDYKYATNFKLAGDNFAKTISTKGKFNVLTRDKTAWGGDLSKQVGTDRVIGSDVLLVSGKSKVVGALPTKYRSFEQLVLNDKIYSTQVLKQRLGDLFFKGDIKVWADQGNTLIFDVNGLQALLLKKLSVAGKKGSVTIPGGTGELIPGTGGLIPGKGTISTSPLVGTVFKAGSTPLISSVLQSTATILSYGGSILPGVFITPPRDYPKATPSELIWYDFLNRPDFIGKPAADDVIETDNFIQIDGKVDPDVKDEYEPAPPPPVKPDTIIINEIIGQIPEVIIPTIIPIIPFGPGVPGSSSKYPVIPFSRFLQKDRFAYLADLASRISGTKATRSQREQLLDPRMVFTGFEARPLV